MNRLRLVIVISGAGSNMQAIAEACRAGQLDAEIVLVVTNRSDAGGLQRAAELGLPTRVVASITGESREQFDQRLCDTLNSVAPDLVVLAGYMRILSAQFVAAFAGRLLNIHPSLLPRHKGLHTHQRALEAGDAEHGATVHLVTAELDGGPPLLQGRLAVRADDTAESLAQRVQRIEHQIYPAALQLIASGRLRTMGHYPELDGQPLVEPLKAEFED